MAKSTNKKKMKIFWIIITFLILVLIGYFVTHKHSFAPTPTDIQTMQKKPFGFDNFTININEEPITFRRGAYESSNKQHVALIMNATASPDGNHAAAIIVDSPGGSGTFYSLVTASKIDGKVVYSQLIPLGDRIKIKSLNIEDSAKYKNGLVMLFYMDRPENAPMSMEPNIEVIEKYEIQDNGNLLEVN